MANGPSTTRASPERILRINCPGAHDIAVLTKMHGASGYQVLEKVAYRVLKLGAPQPSFIYGALLDSALEILDAAASDLC